jgi:hypothetical protein
MREKPLELGLEFGVEGGSLIGNAEFIERSDERLWHIAASKSAESARLGRGPCTHDLVSPWR